MAQGSARPRRRFSPLLPLAMFGLLLAATPFVSPLWAARVVEEASWPQEFKIDGTKLVFYEPQWDALEKNVLTGRAALGITASGKSTPVFGAAWIEADV